MKTNELTGAALDWAVEWAETGVCSDPDDFVMRTADESPSTNWAQGGPIIEREKIGVTPMTPSVGDDRRPYWFANHENNRDFQDGATALIAAMRCYVASKLGDEVEVPEELK